MNDNPRGKSSGKTLEITYLKIKVTDNSRDPNQKSVADNKVIEAKKPKKLGSRFQSITEFDISLQTNTEFGKVPVSLLGK